MKYNALKYFMKTDIYLLQKKSGSIYATLQNYFYICIVQ